MANPRHGALVDGDIGASRGRVSLSSRRTSPWFLIGRKRIYPDLAARFGAAANPPNRNLLANVDFLGVPECPKDIDFKSLRCLRSVELSAHRCSSAFRFRWHVAVDRDVILAPELAANSLCRRERPVPGR
jgi:hypothetical protein